MASLAGVTPRDRALSASDAAALGSAAALRAPQQGPSAGPLGAPQGPAAAAAATRVPALFVADNFKNSITSGSTVDINTLGPNAMIPTNQEVEMSLSTFYRKTVATLAQSDLFNAGALHLKHVPGTGDNVLALNLIHGAWNVGNVIGTKGSQYLLKLLDLPILNTPIVHEVLAVAAGLGARTAGLAISIALATVMTTVIGLYALATKVIIPNLPKVIIGAIQLALSLVTTTVGTILGVAAGTVGLGLEAVKLVFCLVADVLIRGIIGNMVRYAGQEQAMNQQLLMGQEQTMARARELEASGMDPEEALTTASVETARRAAQIQAAVGNADNNLFLYSSNAISSFVGSNGGLMTEGFRTFFNGGIAVGAFVDDMLDGFARLTGNTVFQETGMGPFMRKAYITDQYVAQRIRTQVEAVRAYRAVTSPADLARLAGARPVRAAAVTAARTGQAAASATSYGTAGLTAAALAQHGPGRGRSASDGSAATDASDGSAGGDGSDPAGLGATGVAGRRDSLADLFDADEDV